MSPRLLRNLLLLTAEAERKIRAAGHTPPPREYIMSALAGHARLVTKASSAAVSAERQSARAQALARECAESAVSMADAVADACIEALPAQQPPFDARKVTKFDPARHVVTLVSAPGVSTAPLTPADLS